MIKMNPQPPVLTRALSFEKNGDLFYAVVLPEGWRHGVYKRPPGLRTHLPSLHKGVWYWIDEEFYASEASGGNGEAG